MSLKLRRQPLKLLKCVKFHKSEWAVMSEEIVIIEVKPKIFDINTFDCEPGTFSVRTNFERKVYEVNQPISYKPKFLAIRDPDTCQVELLYRIDLTKSVFEKGQIVPLGNPLTKGYIPLKVSRSFIAIFTLWF
jgi:hypothetical protein